MGRLLVWFLGSLLLVLGACQEQEQPPARDVPYQLLQAAAQRQAGQQLFRQHCRECHGSLSEGRNPRAARFVPPAPDFFSSSYRTRDPAYLYWRIATGKQVEPFRSRGSVMPAWQAYFSEEQIWQLVAYIRQRAGEKTRLQGVRN